MIDLRLRELKFSSEQHYRMDKQTAPEPSFWNIILNEVYPIPEMGVLVSMAAERPDMLSRHKLRK